MRVLFDTYLSSNQESDILLINKSRDLLDTLKEAEAEVISRKVSLEDLKINDIDFIITENRGIHKEAAILGINDRVLLIDEALLFLKSYLHECIGRVPPPLVNEPMKSLDIEDPIFDSLKEDYGDTEFRSWFKRTSEKGRRSWVYYREDGNIGALLIYKFENESIDDADPPLPKKERLKVATLKVTYVGNKIGELFIKMAVDISINKDINEIYLTHFTKADDYLVDLITQYGFQRVSKKNNNEDIFVKKLIPDRKATPIEVSRIFYPSFYDGEEVKKFIIPIKPEFHNRLFTDFGSRQTTLCEHTGEFIIEGNTITKAYISHARTRKVDPGDLLLFYRSEDIHAITSIGVIEEVFTGIQDRDQVLKLVGKRTVFSKEEIEDLIKKNPITIFLFRHHFHLKNPVHLKELKALGIIRFNPMSVIKISQEGYEKIKDIGGIDGRFAID